MKILITGMTGFIGRHLASFLQAGGNEIVGTALADSEKAFLPRSLREIPIQRLDMRNRVAVETVLRTTRADVIYHLAGQAYVLPSYRDPVQTFETNVLGTIYLLEAARRSSPQSKVAVACSGAAYGWPRSLPIREDHPFEPVSPYGASKAAQDILAHQYFRSHGIRTYRQRLFGTTGPGKVGDAPNDFAVQIARIEANGGRGVVEVGDLSTARDISDVRDTVRAMCTIVERGEPGEAYNVGQGRAIVIREVLDTLIAQTRAEIRVKTARKRLRPVDEPILFPDVTKLHELGWRPEFPLKDTLRNLLEFWRTHQELIPREATAA